MTLNPTRWSLQELDSRLAKVRWEKKDTLSIVVRQGIPNAPILLAILSHPQCRIAKLELDRHVEGDLEEMDQVLTALLEPCCSTLRALYLKSFAPTLHQHDMLQQIMEQGNITQLTLLFGNGSNSEFVSKLALMLASKSARLQRLHLFGKHGTTAAASLPMPAEMSNAIASEQSCLTSLTLHSNTFELTNDGDATWILRSKLAAIKCYLGDNDAKQQQHGLDFWANILQTPGNKLKSLSLTGRRGGGALASSTDCFTQALASEHCVLERLQLMDMEFSSFKITSAQNRKLKELVLKRSKMSTKHWLAFAHTTLPFLKSLTKLEVSNSYEFDDKCALVLADWLERPECKLRGELNLEHTGVLAGGAIRLIQAWQDPNCLLERISLTPFLRNADFPQALLASTTQRVHRIIACLVMISATRVPRLGKASALRRLPQELIRLVADCLLK